MDIAATFIEALVEDDDENEYTKDVLTAFMTGSKISAFLSNVTTIVLYAEVVSGNLSVIETCFETKIGQNVKINLEEKYPNDNVENCVRWALFNIKLLKKLYVKEIENSDSVEDDSTEIEDTESIKTNALSVIKETSTNILYVLAMGHLYCQYYSSVSTFFH